LKEVFESINLTAYDLSIDTLDMHVSRILSVAEWLLTSTGSYRLLPSLRQVQFEIQSCWRVASTNNLPQDRQLHQRSLPG
jgi:hypothetical protein